MREFPDGTLYEKKAFDMKLLTYIERKVATGHEPDRDDLVFLYEINGPIEGFGYKRDPRIEEIRSRRNPIADATIVFECSIDLISRSAAEIMEGTRAYIGPLEPSIFGRLQAAGIEHIYATFPEGRIERSELMIGGKSVRATEIRA